MGILFVTKELMVLHTCTPYDSCAYRFRLRNLAVSEPGHVMSCHIPVLPPPSVPRLGADSKDLRDLFVVFSPARQKHIPWELGIVAVLEVMEIRCSFLPGLLLKARPEAPVA